MKSVMEHSFSRVPSVSIPRSSFDRSHGLKTAFYAGYLTPIFVDEALPGDTFNCNMAAFARMSTPIYPIMDNMYLDTQFFAVPIRILWDNFPKFMGEQIDPGDSTDYLVPTMTAPAGGYVVTDLSDHLGIPTEIAGIEHSSLFHRAYNLIWNQWYRDQNLQDSVVVDKDDGPDDPADYTLLRRGKRHDYFTSCLPWPQKGEAVEMPLGDRAPVLGIGTENNTYTAGTKGVRESNGVANTYFNYQQADATNWWVEQNTTTAGYPGIYADLSDASAATINELRQSFQVQKLLERDARGGTRYTEIIKSHFGVNSPDQRLQRPEYLGGGSTPINITPVLATAKYNGVGPVDVGDTGAFTTVAVNNHGFTKSFTEHCLLIGLVSVRADLTYQQGLDRMFSRQTRYDFYWPSLSHIGEQAVLNKEIYMRNVAADDDVFGYQERYAEYRYKPSRITSAFRSEYSASLDAWHLSQEFSALPTLGADFIVEDPPMSRILITPTEPHFIFDSYFKMRCVRPMPLYGVPGLIDHF